MKTFKPFGIDVSSAMESEKGVKDPVRIIKFLYKLSLDYPFIATDIKLNGVNVINGCVNLFGDLHVNIILS